MNILEDDCFALAEWWHVSPVEILKIPFSRRRRMVRDKAELEEKRAQSLKSRNM